MERANSTSRDDLIAQQRLEARINETGIVPQSTPHFYPGDGSRGLQELEERIEELGGVRGLILDEMRVTSEAARKEREFISDSAQEHNERMYDSGHPHQT